MHLLTDPVSSVKFIGGAKGSTLNEGGIFTVQELFNYFPYRYRDTTHVLTTKALFADAQKIPLFTQLTVSYTLHTSSEVTRSQ